VIVFVLDAERSRKAERSYGVGEEGMGGGLGTVLVPKLLLPLACASMLTSEEGGGERRKWKMR